MREGQAGRFADLLDEDPGIEAELRALVEEVAAHLPAVAVSAADHSVAADRDVPRGTRAWMQALREEIGDEVTWQRPLAPMAAGPQLFYPPWARPTG